MRYRWLASGLLLAVTLAASTALFRQNQIAPVPGGHTHAGSPRDYEYWAHLTEEEGVQVALASLAEASADGSNFDCHQYAHEIGRTGYRTFGRTVFGMCSASCHSGCYHGAMQVMIPEIGTENIAQFVPEVCEPISDSRFTMFECLHGLGHGVMMYQTYDLPAALATCDQLPGGFTQRSCYGGVFMENVVGDPTHGALPSAAAQAKPWISFDDPHFPCNAIDQKYQYECYGMQTSQMLRIWNGEFNRVAAACLEAPSDLVATCFISYGRDAAGQTLRDPRRIASLCGRVPQEHFEHCIRGAENVIIDFWGAQLTDQVAELCRVLDDGKEYCYDLLGSRLPGIFPDPQDWERICATAEEGFPDTCRRAAGLPATN